jgi:pimeloyl-ACP methyl ester carboxylesterase
LVGLVLVATGAHPLVAGEVANRERVIDLANQQGMQALCDQWLPPMLAPGTKETNSSLYQSLQQMVLDAGVELHERQIRALINRPDATNVLQQLSVPTLFVAGEHDGWSTPAQHSQMAERVSSSEVYQLDGVGHFLQAEAPQEFSQLLLGWMARQQMV